ncbi:MAG: right-handed parallel beta-helix repeat-containing protein [bacterium]|nr:right-handed parallel beta-helix repeat-containing protein [bacterium]
MSSSFILFLLALLSLAAPAWATVITVSGDQTGTWSADTVIVTAEVRVPPGQSLTILPGVEVLFSVYCKLIVDNGAILRAVGTPTDSIRFDVLPPDTAWHGLRFLSASDSSRLEYCHLTHGSATGSGGDENGGAIYCSSSSPNIEHCLIQSCSATYGGAFYCTESNPIINGNTVSGNSGGGIYCHYSNPIISGNTISETGGICCDNSSPVIAGNNISQNVVGYCGGGIRCFNNSNPNIHSNTIIGNSAVSAIMYAFGGGIYSANSSPIIIGNIIQGNVAQGDESGGYGGGIYCSGSNAIIELNEISHNFAYAVDGPGYGGGAYLSGGTTWFNKNSVVYNSASWGMTGGLYCSSMIPDVINCIFWGNSLPQISGSGSIAYSNIQGGYTGTGNIDAYPAFVDSTQHDCRLQWGSPCIDTGDPNPIYNDPDFTRADMGAWYYDQSMPVRILLTPYNMPIEIPASGGSFQFALHVINIDDVIYNTTIWCDVTLPSGNIYGPLLGPVIIPVASQTLSRIRTQIVPANAPAGIYHYNVYAVAERDTSLDSFTFTKAGGGGFDGLSGWSSTGEDFDGGTPSVASKKDMTKHVPPSIFPNPFNPNTVISYELQTASFVKLSVYDVSGRLVTRLVNGWREKGLHDVTVDGSGLPSGIYFAKLTAGDYSQVEKLVLMK